MGSVRVLGAVRRVSRLSNGTALLTAAELRRIPPLPHRCGAHPRRAGEAFEPRPSWRLAPSPPPTLRKGRGAAAVVALFSSEGPLVHG